MVLLKERSPVSCLVSMIVLAVLDVREGVEAEGKAKALCSFGSIGLRGLRHLN